MKIRGSKKDFEGELDNRVLSTCFAVYALM